MVVQCVLTVAVNCMGESVLRHFFCRQLISSADHVNILLGLDLNQLVILIAERAIYEHIDI